MSLEGLEITLQERAKKLLGMKREELSLYLKDNGDKELIELCRIFRMCMRLMHSAPVSKVQSSLFVIEQAWKLTYYLFEGILGNQEYLIKTGTEEAERELERKRREMDAEIEEIKRDMQLRVEECRDTISTLKTSTQRLA